MSTIFNKLLKQLINENLEKPDYSWAIEAIVPEAPGTVKIPSNHVRFFHYTRVYADTESPRHKAAESLRKNGLNIEKALGSTYGEPNVIWASPRPPDRYKVVAEFSVDRNDPRWLQGKPSKDISLEEYNNLGWDVYFSDSIKPNEIITVHEPWHYLYRYVKEHDLFDQIKTEDYDDDIMNRETEGPAIIKIKGQN